MKRASLFPTLCLLMLFPGSAAAAELGKIDRVIAKEPAYKSKPKYCRLVFGPEAKTRIWLVFDDDILYIDRNGNGDLTDPGERVEAYKKSQDSKRDPLAENRHFGLDEIVESDGKSKHTNFRT